MLLSQQAGCKQCSGKMAVRRIVANNGWIIVKGAHKFVNVHSVQNLPVDACLVSAEPEGRWRRGHGWPIEGRNGRHR